MNWLKKMVTVSLISVLLPNAIAPVKTAMMEAEKPVDSKIVLAQKIGKESKYWADVLKNIAYGKTYEPMEMQAAAASNLIPMTLNMNGDITAEAFIDILENMIVMKDGDIEGFKSKVKKSSSLSKSILRKDAAFGFYLAAEAIGIDNRFMNGVSSAWLRDEHTDAMFRSVIFSLPNEVTIVVDDYDEQQYPASLAAILFCVTHGSVLSKNPTMTTDDDNYFHHLDNLSAKDAVLGAWRLFTSEQQPRYVTLAEAAQDKHTIPVDILTKDSKMPEIAYGNIPKYNAVMYQMKGNAYGYGSSGWFDEDSIHALSDAGVNFISVWLDFSTLQYPDFVDGQINLNELCELDRLIEWGITYDVHICIEMTGVPNHGGYPKGLACYDPAKFSYGGLDGFDGEGGLSAYIEKYDLRGVIQKYWELLAKRYANVPAQFLSFNLEVEIGLPSEKEYVATYLPLAEAMRSYNNDRVIFVYANVSKVFEGLASYGYPMAWSFYQPGQLTIIGENEHHLNYDGKWPSYYLNGVLSGTGKKASSTITINLETKITAIRIHARNKSGRGTPMTIKNGNTMFKTKRTEDDNDWYFIDAEFKKYPKQLSIAASSKATFEFDAIILTKADGTKIQISPFDFNESDTMLEKPVLTIGLDGAVLSSKTLDIQTLVNDFDYLAKYLEIEKKYGVGIIMAEWGVSSNVAFEDPETSYNYMRDADSYFDSLNITAAGAAPVVSTLSVIKCKGTFDGMYYKDGENSSYLIEPERYKPLPYSSKYYIDTYVAKELFGYKDE